MLLGTGALVTLGASAGMKRNIVASETRQPCPVSIGLTEHHFIQGFEQARVPAVVTGTAVASASFGVVEEYGVPSVFELTAYHVQYIDDVHAQHSTIMYLTALGFLLSSH